MAAEDNDIELWRRIDAAMEALPRPDRGRLARIEHGVLISAAPRRGVRLRRFFWAALLGGTAAAAGLAYFASNPTDGGSSGPENAAPDEPALSVPSGKPAREPPPQSEPLEIPEENDPIIHQR